MTRAVLIDVTTAVHARTWRGGIAGCLLPLTVARLMRNRLLDVGISRDDLHALPEVLTHPETLLLGDSYFSTIGRRPYR